MNWLRKWFCKEFELVEVEKSISEPIISFVECVRNNPKRFKVIYDFEYTLMRLTYDEHFVASVLPDIYIFSLKDNKTLESWTLSGGSFRMTSLDDSYPDPVGKHTRNPEWLTRDEREYLIVNIKAIMSGRKERKERLIEIRKQRRIRDERNRLKGVYCD